MSKADESAFPSQAINNLGDWRPVGGLTKREYFAAAAMQGLLSDSTLDTSPEGLARLSLVNADALLSVLSQETECEHESYMSERGLPYCKKCHARLSQETPEKVNPINRELLEMVKCFYEYAGRVCPSKLDDIEELLEKAEAASG